jgi:peptidoglycan/xylan/chitin deacetylase (PgdA/CDA1 family)
MALFHKTPTWVKKLFPNRLWNGNESKIYLTFDDGPVPGATDFVLNELGKRDMKATFFMVGDNVRKHESLAKEVLEAGNKIGNHTYNHLLGLKTPTEEYLNNVELCDLIFQEKLGVKSTLFRPPYGWMKYSQARIVSKSYQIAMWDVLSTDYDSKVSPDKVLNICQKNSAPGSILLFHDQEKTKNILPSFLPDFLDFVKDQGWETASL